MVGEKYWYVLDQDKESPQRLAQLRAQFPKAFSFKSKGDLEENKRYRNNTFVLEPRQENGTFRSEYCLGYQTDNPTEAKQLAALGFDKKPDGYETCSAVTGKIYAVGNLKVPAEYRFESRLPVQIGRSYIKSASVGKKAAADPVHPVYPGRRCHRHGNGVSDHVSRVLVRRLLEIKAYKSSLKAGFSAFRLLFSVFSDGHRLKHFFRGGHGFFNQLRRMRGGDETGFVGGGAEGDLFIQHAVEKGFEAVHVGACHVAVVCGRPSAKYRPNMPPTLSAENATPASAAAA